MSAHHTFEMRSHREGSPLSVDMVDWEDSAAVRDKYHYLGDASVPRYDSSTHKRVRMCSFNIHGWRDTYHVDNLQRLTDVLRNINADVIALQEVLHPFRPPSQPDQAKEYFERVKVGKGNGFQGDYMQEDDQLPYLEELAQALGLPHISFGLATRDGYFGEFDYGNAILSRYPIISESHYNVKPDARHQAGRRIEAEDRAFSIVTLDLGNGEQATCCVTHLDQLSDELRTEQVREMLQFTRGIGPHMFVGDLNVFQKSDCSPEGWEKILDDAKSKGWPAPPAETQAISELKSAGYLDSFWESDNHRLGKKGVVTDVEGMAGDCEYPGASCWVIKPLLRIDYAFLSKELVESGVRVLQHQRVLADPSDHYPIVVDVAFAIGGCEENN